MATLWGSSKESIPDAVDFQRAQTSRRLVHGCASGRLTHPEYARIRGARAGSGSSDRAGCGGNEDDRVAGVHVPKCRGPQRRLQQRVCHEHFRCTDWIRRERNLVDVAALRLRDVPRGLIQGSSERNRTTWGEVSPRPIRREAGVVDRRMRWSALGLSPQQVPVV